MFENKPELAKNYTDVGIERTNVDDGLRAYLVSVYNHMAGALAVTAAAAFLVANTSLITLMFNPQTGGMSVLGWLFLLSPLIVIFGFNWVLVRGSLAQVRGVFWLYSVLMGFSLAPIFLVYTQASMVRVFLITEHLEKDGEIIRTEPSADLLEEGDFDTDFRMIYLTKDSVDEVKSIIESNTEIDSYIVEEFKEPAAEEEKAEEKPETEEKKTEEKPAEEKKPAEKKPAAKTQAPAHKAKNQAIRVDLTRLDRFLNLVSEIVVYRNQLEDATDRESIGEIRDSLEQVSRLTSELQDLVLKIRMQQVSVVFSRFPRMVRDLSNQLNKEMKLEIIGEETELDKTVVSELSEPLIHLLRNSADHGIEDPETRKKLGKPEVGTITLAAYQEGNKVLITLSDDGKGLKPEIIKASAEKKGIDTTGMTDRELQMLVFHPGFSTAKKITNISGRGVGLDAVQAKIAELGGSIEMDSKVDVGTTFIIKLPLTLSIIQALMVQIGKESFAIPLDVVERVVMVREKDIMQTSNQEVCKFQEGLIPIIRTDKLLQVPSSSSDKKYAIIVKIGKQYYGVLVDKMVGQQEIVIKKIDPMLQKIKKYQGATILGNGSIALILDVNAICNSRQ